MEIMRWSVIISLERARELGLFFKRFGEQRISIFEERDPQFKALEHLFRVLGDCSSLALLTVLNSVISYNLSSTGEDYWWEFAKYNEFRSSIRDPERLWMSVKKFLLSCEGNTIGREQKLKRLIRLREEDFHIELYARAEDYMRDLDSFVERLAEVLRQDISDKTIVFAAKMLYYVSRLCGVRQIRAGKIKIPIDRRVALVSYTSELVNIVAENLDEKIIIEATMRDKDKVHSAWSLVSETSGIPQIKLDSVIWSMGKYVREKDSLRRAITDLETKFKDRIERELLVELADQLLRRKIGER
ncbi:MAG: N-glycosylase/DNA lyase [Sulfolobales archaeon]